MGSEYQAGGSVEAITVEMGRFSELGDFASQVGALRHDVAMAVRELAERFADVDAHLLRTVAADEVDSYFSGRLTVPRTTGSDVFDRLADVELRDDAGRLASALAEEMGHEQAEAVAVLWDARLNQQGSLSASEQITSTVEFLRGNGASADVADLLDDPTDTEKRR